LLAGDISGSMVAAALADGLPAVRQRADQLLLRDDVLDAVLIAYGSHHIAPSQRPRALSEAYRVLVPGGRVALHDFASDSPGSRMCESRRCTTRSPSTVTLLSGHWRGWPTT